MHIWAKHVRFMTIFEHYLDRFSTENMSINKEQTSYFVRYYLFWETNCVFPQQLFVESKYVSKMPDNGLKYTIIYDLTALNFE